jgi:modification methylase
MDEEEYQLWQIDVMNELYRVTKDDGNFFYNHKNRISEGVLITPYSWILKTNWIVRQEIVWDTTNIVNPDDRRFLPIHEQIYWLSKTITRVYNNTQRFSDCWVFRNNLTRRETGHPATFPIEIVIRILSVLPDAKLVLDPFMGSGTTAVACVENNRDFVGIEISERYVDTASERIKLSAAQGMLF